jgi:predicted RNA-binding protein (virulence factor B family)
MAAKIALTSTRRVMNLEIGQYNNLKVLRIKTAGAYLDDGAEGVLLPSRYVPGGTKPGDQLRVFIYHDSEDRLIATTEIPKAVCGDIVMLKVAGLSKFGAFMDWGLPKDLFVPRTAMRSPFRQGGSYLLYLMPDPKSGRIMATQYFDHVLTNEPLTVKEKDPVHLTAYRKTDIGYVMIINHRHTGILHFNEIYQSIEPGDEMEGYVVKIRPDHTIDLRLGKPGYERTDTEAIKILSMLESKGGYLPYHDKTAPEMIYEIFGMSKKAFKMAIGRLYKQRKIEITQGGIKSLNT